MNIHQMSSSSGTSLDNHGSDSATEETLQLSDPFIPWSTVENFVNTSLFSQPMTNSIWSTSAPATGTWSKDPIWEKIADTSRGGWESNLVHTLVNTPAPMDDAPTDPDLSVLIAQIDELNGLDDAQFETRFIGRIQGWVRILQERRSEFSKPDRQAALRTGFSNPLLFMIRNRRRQLTAAAFDEIMLIIRLAWFTEKMIRCIHEWRQEAHEWRQEALRVRDDPVDQVNNQ